MRRKNFMIIIFIILFIKTVVKLFLVLFDIDAIIRKRQDIKCLPYKGFFTSSFLGLLYRKPFKLFSCILYSAMEPCLDVDFPPILQMIVGC